MTDRQNDLTRFNDLLDRYGADLTAWPDRDAAQWARELALAAPEARRALEDARQVEALLNAREAAFAGDTGVHDRVAEAVATSLPAPPGDGRRLILRLAASFLVAALAGGVLGQMIQPTADPEETELAMLESLLYGPGEGELQ